MDFYLEQAKTPQQAIDRGEAIAADIVESFVELLPIFDASTSTGALEHKDQEVLAVRERTTEMRSERLTVEQLADYFRMQAGLNFTPYQVAAYVTALQTKGFVILSGLSGTGKTKLAQHFAKLLNPEGDGDNYLFVPVRPDWRENTALIGYYNPLLGTYELTDLLRFIFDAHIQIAEAAKDPATVLPYFILLDEMNLAHVEHYFADFLSVLESGRRADGTSQELVRLHNFEDGKLDATGSSIPMTLRLPPNLYFIGTVNVDETTHSFSPKVLDRAFTIEFDAADLAGYPPLPAPGEGTVLPGEALQLLLQSFTRQGEFARIDKFALAAFDRRHPEFMARLRELEELLRPHEMHFAYRTVDEILMYLVNAETYGWFDGLGELQAAFDSAVLMKILPKFHGPRARLREPLLAVLRWAGTPEDIMSRIDNTNPKYNEALIFVREWLLAPDFREFPCPRVALEMPAHGLSVAHYWIRRFQLID